MTPNNPSEKSAEYDFTVVRDLRKGAGLTLEEVSRRSGVSTAVLSKLERNQNVCELETLYRVARVFGLTASDLLSLSESRTAHRKNAESYQSGVFHFDRLSYEGIQIYNATANTGQSLSTPEAHGDDYEICWVQKGSIRITLPHEEHTLGPGEALKFDAVLTHTYEILEDAELTIVHLTKQHRF